MKCFSALAIIAVATTAFAQQTPVTVKLAQSEIRIGERAIKPFRGPIEYASEHLVGNRRVAITKARVSCTKPSAEEQAWEVTSPDSRDLLWLGSKGDEAYFTVRQGRYEQTYDEPARVRILDLTKGAW